MATMAMNNFIFDDVFGRCELWHTFCLFPSVQVTAPVPVVLFFVDVGRREKEASRYADVKNHNKRH